VSFFIMVVCFLVKSFGFKVSGFIRRSLGEGGFLVAHF